MGEAFKDFYRIASEELILFNSVMYAGNLTRGKMGYNKSFEVLPGIIASDDLLDRGAERIHDDQYREQAEKEYGEIIDPTKENLSSHDAMIKIMNAYHRISIWEGERLVCRIEGLSGMHMSLHRDGEWEEKLEELYRTSDEYRMIYGNVGK